MSLELPVTERLARHLHTLRLRSGEHIVLSDGRGHGWELELAAAVDKRKAMLQGILICEHDSCRCAQLTLVQGLAVSERMDLLVRQATELGIARIIPLESERSTVRLDAAGRQAKLARWQRIAEEAAGQSGQLWLPQIEPPCCMQQALSLLDGCGQLLLFWEDADSNAPSVAQFFAGGSAGSQPRTAVIIGPEGGFSADEAGIVQAAGAATLTLGPTILRTETAAVVATALVLEQLRSMANDRPDAVPAAAATHKSQHRHLS
jgi:16S rRNA (uracil1498-N3)-methyltransferase